jgi:hypothetical protein
MNNIAWNEQKHELIWINATLSVVASGGFVIAEAGVVTFFAAGVNLGAFK